MDRKLELALGLRYFRDEITSRDRTVNKIAPAVENTFNNVAPRVTLTWLPTEQLTTYASFAQGFRSGLNQTPFVAELAPNLPPAKEDKLNNYELGVKGNALDRRLNYEAAVYYIDWKDVQQNLGIPYRFPNGDFGQVVAIVNGQSASGLGFDLGVSTQPVDGLELGANVSWNDLKLDDDVFSGSALVLEKGDRLLKSPEYTVNAFATYSFPLGRNGLQGKFSVSGGYTSKLMAMRTLLTSGLTAEQLPAGDPIRTSLVQFSVGSDHWTTELFVNNVENHRALIEHGPNDFREMRQFPRTFGMQVEYRY